VRRIVLAAGVCFAALLAGPMVETDAAAQGGVAHPWLGIAMDRDAKAGPGVRVGHVIHRSPADLAGIREGDRLVRVGGSRVAHGADVVNAVASFGVGETVEIAFERAGKEQSASVTLASYPSQDEMMRMDLVGTFAPAWQDVEAVSGVFPPTVGALRGRVVLLDFWATWCAPCRVVMPKLSALQARYGAQGLSVLGVSTEEAADVALFAQRAALHYAVAVDRHAETTRSYGVASLPTIVIIDRRGVVRDVSVGYDPMADAHLEEAVRTLLAEAAPQN
jgi:thiol-disulfide isomerase/thioredoxin